MNNGLIALLGSGEYLPVMDEVDRHLLASVKVNGRSPRVVCLPTAAGQEGDETIKRWSRLGLEHFQALGAEAAAPRIIDRQSADDPQWLPQLESADLIYFSGGNPRYLYETLQGSRAWYAAQKAWTRGAVYAGCSAGAMILAAKIPALRTATLKPINGFHIIPANYVIPHFDRLRAIRAAVLLGLRRQLAKHAFILGIDENTALVGRREGEWTVMGPGKVYLITRKTTQEYTSGQTLTLSDDPSR